MLLKLLILCAAICILMATAFVVLYFLGLIVACLKATFQRKKKNPWEVFLDSYLKSVQEQKKNKEKKDEVEPK